MRPSQLARQTEQNGLRTLMPGMTRTSADGRKRTTRAAVTAADDSAIAEMQAIFFTSSLSANAQRNFSFE
jgi:hypothetical protein